MSASARTYWLTELCRIRREDNSVRIERPDHTPVRIPITDIRDLVLFDHADINTAAVSLLSRHSITAHVLDHYGNYAGSLTPAEDMSSAHTVRRQVQVTDDSAAKTNIARDLVRTTAANVAWALDTNLLDAPLKRLNEDIDNADECENCMGVEGNFRRSAWEVLDTMLPPWLRLDGRTRRPPTNAGNAFISYANSIVYARMLTAALHTAASRDRIPARRHRPPPKHARVGPGRTVQTAFR
ncbi:hypothetical protein GCM10027570_44630 [Streptomonospora sediminis]